MRAAAPLSPSSPTRTRRAAARGAAATGRRGALLLALPAAAAAAAPVRARAEGAQYDRFAAAYDELDGYGPGRRPKHEPWHQIKTRPARRRSAAASRRRVAPARLLLVAGAATFLKVTVASGDQRAPPL